jgi:putative flavoprotein involved in K+ transport
VLVNATGSWRRPFWPSYPGIAQFGGRQLHTVDYRRATDFEGQTVLVVGGGNSGAQIAADLIGRTQGRMVWVTARPPRFLPDDVDGRKLFELATRRVRAAAAGETSEQGVGGLGDIVMVPPVLVARRRGDLEAQPMFDRLTPTGVAWDHPSRELEVDAVVWCTGFRPDLRHLARLPLTRRDGLPVTDPALPSRSVDDPALFFLGYGDWCGPASATLIGVGAVARATVEAVVEQVASLRAAGVSFSR